MDAEDVARAAKMLRALPTLRTALNSDDERVKHNAAARLEGHIGDLAALGVSESAADEMAGLGDDELAAALAAMP